MDAKATLLESVNKWDQKWNYTELDYEAFDDDENDQWDLYKDMEDRYK